MNVRIDPFPGVDPFLESQGLWPDFHSKFINCWQEALLDTLPSAYDARLDERVYLVDLSEESTRMILPDVAVERRENIGLPTVRGEPVATLASVTLPLAGTVELREVFIRILHREDRSLVAVLEVLSPANKSSGGWMLYLEKRNEILTSPIHLVELDLLVGGRRLPMGRPLPPAHYYAFVSRSERRPDCDVYSWTVRDRLPKIPIPLLAPDPDVVVDLGQVFATAYQRGRYQRAVDYTAEPELLLAEEDLQWIKAQAAR
jgi:hypothetical protein